MKHHKHPPLPRPTLGQWGRHEWAILGTTCERVQQLARLVVAALGESWACAYLDADHALPAPTPLQEAGVWAEYTEAGEARRFRFSEGGSALQTRATLSAADLILVNGNHHPAAAQVVVLDTAKLASLHKRVAQLTNVQLLLMPDLQALLPDFLQAALPNISEVPRLHWHDEAGIVEFFTRQMGLRTPSLRGVVLAGGRSLRMGQDKGSLAWHGRPQRDHLTDLLAPFCQEVYLSCRPDQVDMLAPARTLPDTFAELGPYGALLSAFRQNPDTAWLVVACDLPLLDAATLHFLVKNRHPRYLATAFRSPHDGLPEPLLSIWEPKAYAALLGLLAQGYSCPRKVLLQYPVHLLEAPDPAALTNVNTPEEAAALTHTLPHGGSALAP